MKRCMHALLYRKWLRQCMIWLLVCIAGFMSAFLLPNQYALQNIRSGLQEWTMREDEIHEVCIENADEFTHAAKGSPKLHVTGCYLQAEGREMEDLRFDAAAPLICEETNIYYITQAGEEYSEERVVRSTLHHEGDHYRMHIGLKAYGLRIDLVSYDDTPVHLLHVEANSRKLRWLWQNMIPWLAAVCTIFILKRTKYRFILMRMSSERKLLWELGRQDLHLRYAGMAFSKIWAYVQPLLTIFVMWYVFQVGFQNPPVRRTEFIIWFMAGYVPWMYFNDAIMSIAGAVRDYAYLVKKTQFPVSILPSVRLLSGMLIHIFFMAVLTAVLLFYGHQPEIIWLQIVYYSFALTVWIYALGLFCSAVCVLVKDFPQFLGVVLQVLFWYTPIVWNFEDISESMKPVFSANPLFYIIDGYRSTLIDGIAFWEMAEQNLAFWLVCMGMLCVGVFMFGRCRPHFADLL